MKILRNKIGIEKEIEEFLNHVSRSGMIFRQGCDYYLAGNQEDFSRKLNEISDCEHAGDQLRRSINEYLYKKTLIPESRGDVTELMENMDSLLDRFKGALWRFEIEQPDLCEEFHDDFRNLVNSVIEATEAIVLCAGPFLPIYRRFLLTFTRFPTGSRKVTRFPRSCSQPFSEIRLYASATRCSSRILPVILIKLQTGQRTSQIDSTSTRSSVVSRD